MPGNGEEKKKGPVGCHSNPKVKENENYQSQPCKSGKQTNCSFRVGVMPKGLSFGTRGGKKGKWNYYGKQ